MHLQDGVAPQPVTAWPRGCLTAGRAPVGVSSRCHSAAASRRLDGKHVVFGKVVKGMGVVKEIEACGSQGGETSKKIVIAECGELPPSDPAFLDKD